MNDQGSIQVVATPVRTDPRTRSKLGAELLEVTDCLWPKDCQTCGRALAEGARSLVVDDLGAFAMASLHHLKCRAPAWVGTGMHIGASQATLSHASQALTLSYPGQPGEWAMIITNPSLEAIPLRPDDGGAWRVSLSPFSDMAFETKRTAIGQPMPGVSVTLGRRGSFTITTDQLPPYETYTAPAGGPELRLATQQGGLIWGVTYALHPAYLTPEKLGAELASGRVLTGWAGIDGE